MKEDADFTKKRNVRAEAGRDPQEVLFAELPEKPFETREHRGGVRASPAESRADGDFLSYRDRDPFFERRLLQVGRSGRRGQVVPARRNLFSRGRERNSPALPDRDRDLVEQAHGLGEGLDFVVPVGASPQNPKKQVHLGGREKPHGAHRFSALGSKFIVSFTLRSGRKRLTSFFVPASNPERA